jgi:hypothetical protein
MHDQVSILGVDGPSFYRSSKMVSSGETPRDKKVCMKISRKVRNKSLKQSYWIELIHGSRISGLKWAKS